jgi:hypothetical protein
MASKGLLTEVVVTFVLTFVVTLIVTYLYSLIAHGAGVIDWGTAVRFSIIFAIVLPGTRMLAQKDAGG